MMIGTIRRTKMENAERSDDSARSTLVWGVGLVVRPVTEQVEQERAQLREVLHGHPLLRRFSLRTFVHGQRPNP